MARGPMPRPHRAPPPKLQHYRPPICSGSWEADSISHWLTSVRRGQFAGGPLMEAVSSLASFESPLRMARAAPWENRHLSTRPRALLHDEDRLSGQDPRAVRLGPAKHLGTREGSRHVVEGSTRRKP